MKTVLITGCGGLIGCEAATFFEAQGFSVVGVDNNMRKYFFGTEGDVSANIAHLRKTMPSFTYVNADVRDVKTMETIFRDRKIDLVIHTAAQPSHNWADREPMTDFSINATGTLVMLDAVRRHAPEAAFVFFSTNKVYGDRPNTLPLIETATRYELPADHPSYQGIDETMSIDQCKHSLFGASKAAADLLVQEYGRYFGLKTVCFRGGCLTGNHHAGVEMHGFLSYLVKCIVAGKPYTIYGYQGKQVRDNINCYDVVNACCHFYRAPRSAAVYNLGGSRFSNISMKEAIEKIEAITGKKARITYLDQPRNGDHIWYISDVRAFKRDYPAWDHTIGVDAMLESMCAYELKKIRS